MTPRTLDEVREAVLQSKSLRIVGANSKLAFNLPIQSETTLDLSCLSGIIAYEPDDRYIEVYAGTTINEVQEAVRKKNQCLALPDVNRHGEILSGVQGTVGGLLSMNLPHALSAQCGGPREWTLGLQIIRGNGEVVRCGGHVVKNVAGFNVHRLFVGARGTLGVIVSAVLRLYPLAAVPEPQAKVNKNWGSQTPLTIQRVLPTDFQQARESVGDRLYAQDQASSTLWFESSQTEQEVRFEGDWVIRANHGAKNLDAFPPNIATLFTATKAQLEPDNKLNVGAMGCV